MQGTADPDFHQQVHRVAVKFPPFWDKEVDLWFLNIEAQFVLNHIVQDSTKYYAVVSTLNSDVLAYVSDIVKNPPSVDLYKTLKDRLIAEFSDSEQKRVNDLLTNAMVGDEKPSHLLRRMRRLAKDKVSEDFLKTLWIQRLPNETQTILSVSDGDLDKLAQMADKIIEVTRPQVNEVKQPASDHHASDPQVTELKAQIAELSKQIKHLARPRQRQENRSRNNFWNRARQRSPSSRNNSFCWYHYNFAM